MLLTLVSGAAVAAGFGLLNRFRLKAIVVETIANNPNEDAPRRIGPLAPVLFSKDSDEAACIQRLLHAPQPGPRNLPYCLHLIRLYGWDPIPGPHFSSGREVLAALTDLASSERYFGESAFFQTRSGIRYRPYDRPLREGVENHRDVCLATFAEAGLPLSTEFTTPSGIFHLFDLLNDSVQNFHLQQEELPWTAVAYALYHSVGQRWINRFGESFGWDEMTEALLAAPFRRASCGGIHLLYAQLIIRRLEGVTLSLSVPVRARLDQRLRATIGSARARQVADGGWSGDWSEETMGKASDHSRGRDESLLDRLLITGHVLECLTIAPPELQPPADVYRRAARWICHVLQDDIANREMSMCPRTHAICAVRYLVDMGKSLRPISRQRVKVAGDGRLPLR